MKDTVIKTSAITAVALLWMFLPTVYSFCIGVAVLWILFQLDARILVAVALVLLLTVPLVNMLNQAGVAENVALYAFLLLCISMLLQTIAWLRASV